MCIKVSHKGAAKGMTTPLRVGGWVGAKRYFISGCISTMIVLSAA